VYRANKYTRTSAIWGKW